MAYFNQNNQNTVQAQGMNSQEDEEKKQQQGMNQPMQLTNQSSSISGEVSAGGVKSAAPAAPAATKAPTAAPSSGMGGGFQNYMKANQGNAQNALNNATQKNLSNQTNLAKTGIQQATNAFSNKADQGTLANRHQAVQDVSNIANAATKLSSAQQSSASENSKKILSATGNPSQYVQTNNLQANGATEIDDNLKQRFSEVINARYQGPESLRQAGLYNPASEKVQKAQTVIDQSKNAVGREDMLRNMFQQRGDYTRGLNKLDAALLNSNQQGVQALKQTAQDAGNLQNQLDSAQIGSAHTAQNRTNEINAIKNQAKDSFTGIQNKEIQATDERLSKVVENWEELPNYFKDIIRNKAQTNSQLLNDNISNYKQSKNYDQISSQLANIDAERKAAQKALMQAQLADSFKYGIALDGYGPNNYNPSQDQLQKVASNLKAAQDRMKQIESQKASLTKSKAAMDAELKAMQDNYNPNAINLNSVEAAMLGIGNGEGLYNMGADAIKVRAAEKDRLISKDEQHRQAALAQLAGLDEAKTLNTNLKYADASKAGTMSALDALDLGGTRAALNEAEDDFRELADETDITGHGKKKVSRGNAFGTKKKTYHATQTGNVEDMLRSAGYDFGSPNTQGQQQAITQGRNLLEAAAAASDTSRDRSAADKADNAQVIGSGAKGAAIGAGIGGAVGSGPGAIIGAGIGGSAGMALGSGTLDPYQQYTDLMVGMGGPLGAAGKAIQDGRALAGKGAENFAKYNPFGFAGDTLGKSLGLGNNFVSKGIGGAIGGISSSAMKSFGNAKAKENAIADLQNQYKGFLEGQGFDNRFNISNNDKVTGRLSALQALLAKMDKTNT